MNLDKILFYYYKKISILIITIYFNSLCGIEAYIYNEILKFKKYRRHLILLKSIYAIRWLSSVQEQKILIV